MIIQILDARVECDGAAHDRAAARELLGERRGLRHVANIANRRPTALLYIYNRMLLENLLQCSMLLIGPPPLTRGLFDIHFSSNICFEVINPHTVGSLTIPRASIKWV